jgi:uncharacterized linocin/CFP29 family protein
MNNLHRELAPISDAAWTDIESEARRTFTQHVAARRVVDLIGPAGATLPGVGTGHLLAIDDVERGAKDADWQPVKDAARQIAFVEDQVVFDGLAGAGITGIRASTSNPTLALPADVREFPTVVAKAVTALRLAGVAGPYSLLLSADAYTAVEETADHGYPIREHVARVLHDGEIIWAPAVEGAFLLSTRGGDYELHLGQDLSIGYRSHDADTVELYFQESFTFVVQTAEAGVTITG